MLLFVSAVAFAGASPANLQAQGGMIERKYFEKVQAAKTARFTDDLQHIDLRPRMHMLQHVS